MTIVLTNDSINKLCNGVNVTQPIVQLLGYEAVLLKKNQTRYRLVLSDGVHMNSYFFLDPKLNDMIVKKQIKYGTILSIDQYKFLDGKNCKDHSPRWTIYIEKIAVLVHRNVLGDPQPLINIEKKNKPLLNLNLNEYPSRMFNSIEQLENNLISVKDLNKQLNSKCTSVLKLTVKKKYPINTHSKCRVLNMNLEDSTGMVRVSAFNSLSDIMDEIFKENKTYYITDTILKFFGSHFELKLQSYSVVIECIETILQNIPSINTSDFNIILDKDPNTFCDLIGVCIEISDIEVCGNSTAQTEIAKREIVLIDKSMATVTLKVWGELVNKFEKQFIDNPLVVAAKKTVLKQFNGKKYFSLIKDSVLFVNPNTAEAHKLKQWYKDLGTMEDL
ncbi:replication protein A 70 kDa DNA-binding subunit-like [Sipha flava]|uniref:Replication protein A 70 kDa DNA-binding subunit-like n=1 Tax=Sipha flava TaxID=143950 RepID=A0A8B8FPU9_9HEMI|nr:replication protein A 70 kDa DNA-binding subunit-like [Sipha flava]